MALTLRQVLIGPFVALVVGTAAGVGALAYHAGTRAVDDLSDRFIVETVGRINQAIERHLYGSEAVLEAAFPNGMPAPASIADDLTGLRTRLWIASSLHTDPNHYVYFGNDAGQSIALDRKSATRAELRLKTDPAAHRAIYQVDGVMGALGHPTPEDKLFDPRERPWYQAGAHAATIIWTSVYIDFTTGELVTTRARRVLGDGNGQDGVIATDVSLRALNDFLGNLKVSEHGVAAILEPSGLLIGSSDGTELRRPARTAGTYDRMPVDAATSAVLRDAAQATRSLIPTLTRAAPMRMVRFRDSSGQEVYGAISRVRDALGLDWVSLVAIPRADLMGAIPAGIRRGVLIGLAGVVGALLLGTWVLNWIARDLRKIAEGARRIGAGELDVALDIRRRDEIGQLARSFATMHHQLRTDALTGLDNRESFRRRLRLRITPAAHARALGSSAHLDAGDAGPDAVHGFAIIFIDLDHFKLINDALGHATGDAVLVEVARRLRACFGAEDTVARLGGDEFAVLMRTVDHPDDVQAHLAAVQAAVQQPYADVEADVIHAIGFGVSTGHALYPQDGANLDDLLDEADRRMYSAKYVTRRRQSRYVTL